MLIVENLCYKVSNFSLKEINLKIDKNEYFILLGPTGSGKTTLIKCISGLYKISRGSIYLNGRDVTKSDIEEKNIGYLPQDYSLFPHLDVYNNILFGLKIRNVSREERGKRLNHIAKILGIENLLTRSINNLSGGEMQRVALARALVVHPEVLLLDEPFSSIDPGLRTQLWFEIKNILKKLDITVVHITHNLDEASAIGDKIAVLINGKIEQIGKKEEVLQRPKTLEVALYQGIKNIYDGEISEIDNGKIKIKCSGFEIVTLKDRDYKTGQRVKFCIRPQDIKIIKEGYPVKDDLKDNMFQCEIVSSYFSNDVCIINVKSVADFEIRFPFYVYKRYKLHTGKKITIGIWQKGINIFS